MTATAAQLEVSEYATIEEVEDFLQHVSSWGNLMTRLICIFLGIFMAIYGALNAVTREDRIVFSFISGVPLLLGIGLICWDVYVRVRLEYSLELMRSAALDLGSPGENS